MRHLQILAVFTIFWATAIGNAFAQDDSAVDRQELLGMLDTVETALNKQQFDTITPLLADDVVAVFLDAEVARGPAAVTAYIDKFLSGDAAILKGYTTTATLGDSARFFGDVAVADGTSTDVFDLADGSQLQIDSVWSVTLSKTTGSWKIVQMHFSANLFDNPLMAEAQERIVLFLVLAAIVGLIVGFLIGRRGRNA